VIVRPIGYADIPALVELSQDMHRESPHYSPYQFDSEKMRKWFTMAVDEPDWLCCVAIVDDRIVGAALVGMVDMIFGPEFFVEDIGIFVRKEWRGSRAAILLMRFVENWGKTRRAVGVRIGVTTGVGEENTERFLRKIGFNETGKLFTKIF